MRYRYQLIQTIQELQNIKGEIFSQILNLSMSGELNDFDKVFDIGEVYDFDIKHFEDSKDFNVVELLKAYKKIDKTISTLININVILDEELNLE
jgi:hypothetical protein